MTREGTGKTYVYIKTMYELNRNNGWSKFIIVVPSIAIREGVKKSLEMTQDHFMEAYQKKIRFFIYDSKNLNQLDSFSSDSGINVMIINMQAFNTSLKEGGRGDARIIYSKRDQFGSRRPIDVIAANNPILILDEPQKMGGKATQNAINNFNPLFTLNYSATHAKQHNLVYALDAVDAYNKKLVKKIEVKGFQVKNLRGTDSYLYLDEIILSPKHPPKAKIEFEINYKKSINRETRILSVDDNLFEISKGMEQYRGFRISEIDPISAKVTFTNVEVVQRGEPTGDVSEKDIRRVQIRETIKSHFEKEKDLFEKGIKTLSLFFIDEVSKYRQYDENGEELLGEYGKIFEQEYNLILNEYRERFDTPYKKYLDNIETEKTHKGYFSIDKKGHIVNSNTKGSSDISDDISAYDLILKNKERLLSFDEPTRFIFSHSALREGWDNPNIFQICTLTFIGKVEDNVYSPKELKLTIGSRSNIVKINEDGTFKYVLKTPSSHFDFINISQPGDIDNNNSDIIDGLDLAINPELTNKKGLERTYVINSYIDSEEDPELPEFKLTTASKVIINSETIDKDKSIKAVKVGDEYFYTINGFTNRNDNEIYVDGEEIFRKDTVDNGSYFEHKVKLQSGMNVFNLRVLDSKGNILKDLKIRIILDTNIPNLILESPVVDEIEVVEVENKDKEVKESENESKDENEEITEVEKEEFYIVKTWKDNIIFKGKISDDGIGYTLIINGDHVQASSSRATFGDNEKEFEKKISVEDKDIITLYIEDEFGNSKEFKYKVEKIEAPKIIEVNDLSTEKEEEYSRVTIKTLEEKVFDVLTGKVRLNEILPIIEDTQDYKFDGWYLSADFYENLKINNLDEFINQDLTIYPKFTEIEKSSSENKEDTETPKNPENPKDSETKDENKDSETKDEKEDTVKKPNLDNKDKTSLDKNNSNSKDKNYNKNFNDMKSEVKKLLANREENPTLPSPDLLGANNEDKYHENKKDLKDSKKETKEENKDNDISNKSEENSSLDKLDSDKTSEVEKSSEESLDSNNSTKLYLKLVLLLIILLIISSLIFILAKKRKKDEE